MSLKTNSKWSLTTTFAVNAVELPHHTHGNKRFYKAPGPAFISIDDAIKLLVEIEGLKE